MHKTHARYTNVYNIYTGLPEGCNSFRPFGFYFVCAFVRLEYSGKRVSGVLGRLDSLTTTRRFDGGDSGNGGCGDGGGLYSIIVVMVMVLVLMWW